MKSDEKVDHICYGKRDARKASCPKHGGYTYFNYLNHCPECMIEEGKCPGCCRTWENLKKKYSKDNGEPPGRKI